jgi:hypothetical protein
MATEWQKTMPNMWEAGNRRIHQVEDRFVAQDGAGYLPGSYASFEAAEAAFAFARRFLEDLYAIQVAIAEETGGVITIEDLESAREMSERIRPPPQ